MNSDNKIFTQREKKYLTFNNIHFFIFWAPNGWGGILTPGIFWSIMEGTSSRATGTVTSMESKLSGATQEAACKV